MAEKKSVLQKISSVSAPDFLLKLTPALSLMNLLEAETELVHQMPTSTPGKITAGSNSSPHFHLCARAALLFEQPARREKQAV